MEAGKQSSSSFTSSLFGAKDSYPSSQILTSIFAPPPKVRGGESLQNENNKVCVTRASSAKTPVQGEEEKKWSSKEKSWCYGEEKVEPFHYSSSIYYGGQDVYCQPNPHNSSVKKNVGEEDDDSGSASRGNWWQGSLYY